MPSGFSRRNLLAAATAVAAGAPAIVRAQSARIVAPYGVQVGDVSGDGAGYFEEQQGTWRSDAQEYFDAVAHLQSVAAGRTYAATEGVFDRLAHSVGLTDVTPAGYLRAASNDSEPAPGDLVAVPATGAYCFSLASNYNYVPRPPVVALAGGRARVIVRGETIDDLLARDAGIRLTEGTE